MVLPNNEIMDVEAHVFGQITSGGSNTLNTVNVFHYHIPPSDLVKNKQAFHDAFDGIVGVPLAAVLNNRWKLLYYTYRWLNDALDAPQSFTSTKVGAVPGDSMPSICAMYMLIRTALRGQSYRGSKHFGPISEGDTLAPNEDVFTPAAMTRFVSLADNMNTGLVDAIGNFWKPCVYSRKLSQVIQNPTSVVTTPVVSITVKKSIGRLRRREAKSVY